MLRGRMHIKSFARNEVLAGPVFVAVDVVIKVYQHQQRYHTGPNLT